MENNKLSLLLSTVLLYGCSCPKQHHLEHSKAAIWIDADTGKSCIALSHDAIVKMKRSDSDNTGNPEYDGFISCEDLEK